MVANRKVFREFTSVRVVQQWQAHTGVIWTVSFSDTGAFMATGGKDRIIRVWENKRAPVEAGCVLPLRLHYCAVSFVSLLAFLAFHPMQYTHLCASALTPE